MMIYTCGKNVLDVMTSFREFSDRAIVVEVDLMVSSCVVRGKQPPHRRNC